MAVEQFATHIWFDNQAEEAANFYVSLFEDAKIEHVNRAPEGTPGVKADSAFVVNLTIMGQHYIFLNGGPMFPLTEALSLYVLCDGQADVDRYWDALLADGGKPSQCGWLVDKFGLSWQIIPKQLGELMTGEHGGAVMAAMLKMTKIEVAGLEAAANGE